MSKEIEEMAERARRIARRVGPKVIVPATVIAINNDDTIEIEFSDGSTVDDCRLKAVVKAGNKVLLIPAVDSNVLVGKIENSDEYIVISVDEITEMVVLVDDVRFKVDASGFLFQKDNDTLKQILTLIVQSVLGIVVLQGRNPDYIKLQQSLVKINNLLL